MDLRDVACGSSRMHCTSKSAYCPGARQPPPVEILEVCASQQNFTHHVEVMFALSVATQPPRGSNAITHECGLLRGALPDLVCVVKGDPSFQNCGFRFDLDHQEEPCAREFQARHAKGMALGSVRENRAKSSRHQQTGHRDQPDEARQKNQRAQAAKISASFWH